MMFYTKYSQIAFYLSYLFPIEPSTIIVKHLKRLNDYELPREFYIKQYNLSKFIPYRYILCTTRHCIFSSCSPSVIYSSIHRKENYFQKDVLKELMCVFSRNFENSSKMLTYICNKKNIFDFYENYYLLNQAVNEAQDLYNIVVDNHNYYRYHNILSYEVKSSRKNKYFIKDETYHYNFQYRVLEKPQKIKNKQFKQSIKNVQYNKKIKTGFRRNY